MASKRKNGEWRATYTLGKRKREITLPSDMVKKDADEFERLARVRARWLHDGIPISKPDERRIDNLPDGLKDRFVAHGLLEGKPDVLSLTGLIDYHKKLRSGASEASRDRDERLYRYLLAYFPEDKPIDTFVKPDAELFRNYLITEYLVENPIFGDHILEGSANKFIRQLKSLFTVAVDAEFLVKSPFVSVKVKKTINKDRQEYISGLRTQEAIEAMRTFVLKFFLAFTRYGGLRPSEVQHLRFSHFQFYENGFARFRIPMSKTDEPRYVPVSLALRPIVDAVFSQAGVCQECEVTNQGYVLPERFRVLEAGAIGVLIRKDLARAKLPVWGKLFINLRSSFVTDLAGRGLTEKQKNCIVGNSEQIRLDHYEQLNMLDEEYAQLGERLLPKDWTEWGKVKTPIDFPIFSIDKESFWETFDDDTPNEEIALTLGKRCGLQEQPFRKMLEQDTRLDVFGNSVKHIRHSLYEHSQGQISDTQLMFRAFGFLGRAAYEFLREIAITPFQSQDSSGARRT